VSHGVHASCPVTSVRLESLAVLGHWDSREDGAIALDKGSDLFADPAKVHRLEHRGKWFKSRGPFDELVGAIAAGVVLRTGVGPGVRRLGVVRGNVPLRARPVLE